MFVIKETKNTPYVKISVKNEVFIIKGNSNAPDNDKFYDTILTELKNQFTDFNSKLICHFNYNIFNSASYKKMIQIFIFLNNEYKLGKDITVKWIFNKGDYDNEIIGKDLSDVFNFPVELISQK